MNHRFITGVGLALVVVLTLGVSSVAAAGDDDVGICVIGVDSPCNGADASNETATNDSATAGEPIQFHPDELPYASGPAEEDADRPVTDRDRTPLETNETADEPIQFHPDELAYASGFGGGERVDRPVVFDVFAPLWALFDLLFGAFVSPY